MKTSLCTCILLVLFSCSDTKKPAVAEKPKLHPQPAIPGLLKTEDAVLKNWTDYYTSIEPAFSPDSFKLVSTDAISPISGNVPGSFDKNFDKRYLDFLVYNPTKNKYIDFDSYQWGFDENGQPEFSPDQEVNLVDLNKKTVSRIAFRGPSQWIEDAFWKNDSTVVLLENNDENYPLITLIDLVGGTAYTYRYGHSLAAESEYSALRIAKKGVNF